MPRILTGIIVKLPCPISGTPGPHHLPDPERQPALIVCVGCPAGKG
jgi:hypothetical protein